MKDSFTPSLDRKSLRLPHFDYSQAGLYFVTIVTQKRACLFGSIIDGEMILSEAGRMVDEVCRELPNFFILWIGSFIKLCPTISMPLSN